MVRKSMNVLFSLINHYFMLCFFVIFTVKNQHLISQKVKPWFIALSSCLIIIFPRLGNRKNVFFFPRDVFGTVFHFPVWLWNWLISAGLGPVLSHLCIASFNRQFSTNIKINIIKLIIILKSAESCLFMRCDK